MIRVLAAAVAALLLVAACSSAAPTDQAAETDDAGGGEIVITNNSSDAGSGRVIVYQQPPSSDPGQTTVAWLVLPPPVTGQSQSVPLDTQYSVNLATEYGDFSDPQSAPLGSAFEVVRGPDGLSLELAQSAAADPGELGFRNTADGAVTVSVKALGRELWQAELAPGAAVSFEPNDLAVAFVEEDLSQGDVLNSAVVSSAPSVEVPYDSGSLNQVQITSEDGRPTVTSGS